jgi:metallophosphoesterase (TIGR00282 family)
LIRVLLVGDVVGGAGRRALLAGLETVVDQERVDFVIANVENAAGGFGVTASVLSELEVLPVHVWTTGNHVWDKKEGVGLLEAHPTMVRPANYPAGNPGRGWCGEETATGLPVAVVQLQGQAMMAPIDNPFCTADRVLAEIAEQHPEVRVIVVDMHAEATSEKQAMGWHLDGRVSAVLGTHTHVPTADERLLPGGTAYQTDVGMTGPYESVIGMRPRQALERFLFNTPRPLQTARRGAQLRATLVEIDELSGRGLAIRRVRVDDERST